MFIEYFRSLESQSKIVPNSELARKIRTFLGAKTSNTAVYFWLGMAEIHHTIVRDQPNGFDSLESLMTESSKRRMAAALVPTGSSSSSSGSSAALESTSSSSSSSAEVAGRASILVPRAAAGFKAIKDAGALVSDTFAGFQAIRKAKGGKGDKKRKRDDSDSEDSDSEVRRQLVHPIASHEFEFLMCVCVCVVWVLRRLHRPYLCGGESWMYELSLYTHCDCGFVLIP